MTAGEIEIIGHKFGRRERRFWAVSAHTHHELYERLVDMLDALIDVVGEDEEHPLASLMEVIGVLIEKYEDQNIPNLPDTRAVPKIARARRTGHSRAGRSCLPDRPILAAGRSAICRQLVRPRSANWQLGRGRRARRTDRECRAGEYGSFLGRRRWPLRERRCRIRPPDSLPPP